jgi:hypothetical protein
MAVKSSPVNSSRRKLHLRAIILPILDGAKGLYPEYLARVRAAESGFLSLPFGEDVEVSIFTLKNPASSEVKG